MNEQQNDDSVSTPALPPNGGWPNLRLFVLRVVAVLGGIGLLAVLTTGSAAWYTSRSQFCRSCHIMEPYYVSWQESAHGNVSCIKCHFPPTVGEKVRGKVLGLVQLAKYFTATTGSMPHANVPDASCLRSGCHETRLLAGRLYFQGVPFDHGSHIQELRKGKQLRCTSCHSQTDQSEHMAVTASTCFLCHFKETPFNEGIGACTHCHQIPEQQYDLGGGVMFNHDLAYERGVGCANCHGDVIQGEGTVPVERCRVCHNRAEDLERITEEVFLHRMHTAEHKVECFACHLEIRHALDPHNVQMAASNCKACHPNQHQEQSQLLVGQGARSVPATPSGMIGARVSCQSCHRDAQVSMTGAVLMKASLQTCTDCHDSTRVAELEQYSKGLNQAVQQLVEALPRIHDALNTAPEISEDRKEQLRPQLQDIEHDVAFLRTGNGIHNIHYAGVLTRTVVEKVGALCEEVDIPAPQIQLPDQALEEK